MKGAAAKSAEFHAYAVKKALRKVAVELWNQPALILDSHEEMNEKRCKSLLSDLMDAPSSKISFPIYH